MEDLSLTDTAFEKYSRYGISLLTHMDIYFQMASLEVKRKMLGSIFPGKLIYQDGKYRTEGMNSALTLILRKPETYKMKKPEIKQKPKYLTNRWNAYLLLLRLQK